MEGMCNFSTAWRTGSPRKEYCREHDLKLTLTPDNNGEDSRVHTGALDEWFAESVDAADDGTDHD